MLIERPLDMLQNLKNQKVIVTLKDEKFYSGILLAFDIHINLVLDNAELNGKAKTGLTFLRGDNVISIMEDDEN